MLAVYVHDLNPVALPLFGNMALRWYGLAYLMGFVAGFLLLRRLARKGMWVLQPEKTGDFIAAAALFGVFLGGRLGHVLFYFRDGLFNKLWLKSVINGDAPQPFFNSRWWDGIAADPTMVFRVWEGGMASHGGILGLMIFTWFYARKYKVSWTGLGDGLCVVAPLGLFFGRAANFINGELYGRIAPGLAWAVKFPTALVDAKAPESGKFEAAAAAAVNVDQALAPTYHAMNTGESPVAQQVFFEQLLEANRHSEKVSEAIAPYLEPRHPSQVYEGLLEGLLLFTILWVVRVCFPKAPHGLLTGLFFGLYAIFRIFAERFREPDAAWVIDGVLTQGQFLSLFMFAFSAAFLVYAWRGRTKPLA